MADESALLDEEPIFWTSTRPGFNDGDRMRIRPGAGPNGEDIIEKHPQIGHVGDIKVKRRAPGVRFIYMIDQHGHEVPVVMTNAAAHLDSSGPWGQYQLAKARHHGWYATGDCPCALLGTGRLRQKQIAAQEILRQEPCQPGSYSRDRPCEHSIAEQKARQARNAKLEETRESRAKDFGQKMIEEQRNQTSELVAAIRDVVASGKKPAKGEKGGE